MATSTIFEPIEIKSKKSVKKFFKMLDEYEPKDDKEYKLPKGVKILTGKKAIKKFFKMDI